MASSRVTWLKAMVLEGLQCKDEFPVSASNIGRLSPEQRTHAYKELREQYQIGVRNGGDASGQKKFLDGFGVVFYPITDVQKAREAKAEAAAIGRSAEFREAQLSRLGGIPSDSLTTQQREALKGMGWQYDIRQDLLVSPYSNSTTSNPESRPNAMLTPEAFRQNLIALAEAEKRIATADAEAREARDRNIVLTAFTAFADAEERMRAQASAAALQQRVAAAKPAPAPVFEVGKRKIRLEE